MRLYSFTNLYISSIQKGIQTAHIVSEISVKYTTQKEKCLNLAYEDWANNHKTVIVLNGGYGENLYTLEELFADKDNTTYPWAAFNEERDALDGARTAIGIIVDERIYEMAAAIRPFSISTDKEFESLLTGNVPASMDDKYGSKITSAIYALLGDNCFGIPYINPFTEFERKLILELNKYHLA